MGIIQSLKHINDFADRQLFKNAIKSSIYQYCVYLTLNLKWTLSAQAHYITLQLRKLGKN